VNGRQNRRERFWTAKLARAKARASLRDETSICAGWAATPSATFKISERWQSGRMRRIRNPVYGSTVPWVRIPPSPPYRLAIRDAVSGCAPNGAALRVGRLLPGLNRQEYSDLCRLLPIVSAGEFRQCAVVLGDAKRHPKASCYSNPFSKTSSGVFATAMATGPSSTGTVAITLFVVESINDTVFAS
jgi:hypothetical protein